MTQTLNVVVGDLKGKMQLTVLTSIALSYEIRGSGLQADAVEKAIRMAEEKDC